MYTCYCESRETEDPAELLFIEFSLLALEFALTFELVVPLAHVVGSSKSWWEASISPDFD